MCLVQEFESLDSLKKGSVIDAAFADHECVWSNVCNKVFHDEAVTQERAVLRKHIIENYYADV